MWTYVFYLKKSSQFLISKHYLANVSLNTFNVSPLHLLTTFLVLQYTYELLGIISENFPLEFSETEAVKLRLDLINAIEALYTDDRATVSSTYTKFGWIILLF